MLFICVVVFVLFARLFVVGVLCFIVSCVLVVLFGACLVWVACFMLFA